jgi:S-adenosylmethionine-diacylgycerolhomoserine-N-methlytransferase
LSGPQAGQAEPAARTRHRAFLNRYYGLSRHVYDATRRYFLFGRDRLLEELGGEPWQRLVEIGPGTGRNLRQLHRKRPDAHLGGVDASDAMVAHARRRCPFAAIAQGFAEDADLGALCGGPPDRVLSSYCLSMVGEPFAALERARAQLAPGGEIALVDFADLGGLPPSLAEGLRRYIGAFHVRPLDLDRLGAMASRLEFGPGRYYVTARISAR